MTTSTIQGDRTEPRNVIVRSPRRQTSPRRHRSRSTSRGRIVFFGRDACRVKNASPDQLSAWATRDLDLLGFGDPAEARLHAVFEDILRTDVGDDGVVFDAASLEVGPIRKGQEYSGVRLLLRATIVSSVVRLQVDVGFGDAVTPGPETVVARAAQVNDLVTRSISGHLTERMQHHYSTVNGREQRDALAKVVQLFNAPTPSPSTRSPGAGGEGKKRAG